MVGGLIKSVITDQAFNVRICRHVTLIVFTLERDIVSGNTTIKQEIYGNRSTRQTPKMVAIMLWQAGYFQHLWWFELIDVRRRKFSIYSGIIYEFLQLVHPKRPGEWIKLMSPRYLKNPRQIGIVLRLIQKTKFSHQTPRISDSENSRELACTTGGM